MLSYSRLIYLRAHDGLYVLAYAPSVVVSERKYVWYVHVVCGCEFADFRGCLSFVPTNFDRLLGKFYQKR